MKVEISIPRAQRIVNALRRLAELESQQIGAPVTDKRARVEWHDAAVLHVSALAARRGNIPLIPLRRKKEST